MVMRYAPVGVFALIAVRWLTLVSRLCGHWRNWCCWSFRHSVLRAGSAGNCGAPVRLSVWILIRILKDELILAYSTPALKAYCRELLRRWKPMVHRVDHQFRGADRLLF